MAQTERQKAREDAAKAAREEYEANKGRVAKRVEELAEREANVKPTPTQEENDLAAVGAMHAMDEKEDHGGEPEGVAVARIMTARIGGDPDYYTRMEEPRRRGRPRKSDE